MKVGQHGVLERAEPILAPQKVRRQRRHRDQLAHRSNRLGELAHQRFQPGRVVPIVAEIRRIEQLQLVGQQVVIAQSQQRVDRLAGLQAHKATRRARTQT